MRDGAATGRRLRRQYRPAARGEIVIALPAERPRSSSRKAPAPMAFGNENRRRRRPARRPYLKLARIKRHGCPSRVLIVTDAPQRSRSSMFNIFLYKQNRGRAKPSYASAAQRAWPSALLMAAKSRGLAALSASEAHRRQWRPSRIVAAGAHRGDEQCGAWLMAA